MVRPWVVLENPLRRPLPLAWLLAGSE